MIALAWWAGRHPGLVAVGLLRTAGRPRSRSAAIVGAYLLQRIACSPRGLWRESYASVAEACGCSRRTVIRAVATLQLGGMIQAHPGGNDKGGAALSVFRLGWRLRRLRAARSDASAAEVYDG